MIENIIFLFTTIFAIAVIVIAMIKLKKYNDMLYESYNTLVMFRNELSKEINEMLSSMNESIGVLRKSSEETMNTINNTLKKNADNAESVLVTEGGFTNKNSEHT